MVTFKDLSNALYSLSKAKGYAATVILTLGLTLGTLVAMFNLNYQILAAPLPYAEEELLVAGSTAWLEKDGSVMYPRIMPQVMIELYNKPSEKLSDQALFGYAYVGKTLRDLPNTPQIQIGYTTPGFMRMYQMPLVLGRAFTEQEETGNHHAVAVLTEQIWREHYNADPALIGRKITIDSVDFTVIGIASSAFREPRFIGPSRTNDVWLPWDFNPVSQQSASSINGWHFYLAKLKTANERLAFEQELRPQINSLFQNAIATLPSQAGRSIRFHAEPVRILLEGDSSSRTLWMFAGCSLLLLIAVTNITNLFLSRAARQQRSLSIQAALGAQRHHLLSQIIAELSLLMLAAVCVAMLVAEGSYALLQSYASTMLPQLSELSFNLPSLIFALSLNFLLALVFTALISGQINYQVLQQDLQSSGKGGGVQIRRRIRNIMITAQVMLAAMLLICSAQVLLQSMSQLRQQVGFSSEQRVQITVDDQSRRPDRALSREQHQATQRQRKEELILVRDLLRQHPAVHQASVSNYPPISFDGVYGSATFVPDLANPSQLFESRVVTTDQYYFPLFEITLLQGRNFSEQEVATQATVVIVNQAFAQKLRPDGDVVGQRLYSQGGVMNYEIIGVSANHHLPDEWSAEEPNRSYVPRNLISGTSMLLQLKPGMQLEKTALNQIMTQVSPHYRAAGIYSIKDNVDRVLFSNYLAAAVTSALVLLSFVLAAIGIYGVLSYSVQLRRFELGVRMAIGARPLTILRQLLGENLKPVLAGLALAAVGLAALWFALQKTTFSVELSANGFALPLLLIVLLTVLTTLLSVWNIIRKPAVYALQGR